MCFHKHYSGLWSRWRIYRLHKWGVLWFPSWQRLKCSYPRLCCVYLMVGVQIFLAPGQFYFAVVWYYMILYHSYNLFGQPVWIPPKVIVFVCSPDNNNWWLFCPCCGIFCCIFEAQRKYSWYNICRIGKWCSWHLWSHGCLYFGDPGNIFISYRRTPWCWSLYQVMQSPNSEINKISDWWSLVHVYGYLRYKSHTVKLCVISFFQ